MIVEVSNEIFTKLKTSISPTKIQRGYQTTSPTFPLVTVMELENSTHEETVDSAGEQYNNIGFEINIFSNSMTASTEIEGIRKKVDDVMCGFYGMNRVTAQYIDNYIDQSITRYMIRYTCVIDKNKIIYRR